ncbi:uncharacterized protein LOC135632391 isoform X2 [Musa acuminata AAA Group]|uniref:uncharacterized protein LOC135632391 isoform X2 n=1 Tax=Musa acuminata AAA Group TaxID=214697 RepID=UPI0031DB03A9
MAMNDHGEEKAYCDFHPMESVVGICALCLKERLLVLASEQRHHPLPRKTNRSLRVLRRKRIIRLPKVFALGPFLNLLELRYQRTKDDSDDEGSIASHEVKFDDAGHASWDSEGADNTEEIDESRGMEEQIEHDNALKWKKRIGQLLAWRGGERRTPICREERRGGGFG